MSDWFIVLLIFISWANGVLFGYITWAPDSAAKRGLIDGMTFKFLWGKK